LRQPVRRRKVFRKRAWERRVERALLMVAGEVEEGVEVGAVGAEGGEGEEEGEIEGGC